MKKTLFITAMLMILACIALTACSEAVTPGNKGEYQKPELPPDYQIEDVAVGDVTGDGICDVVVLIGQKYAPDSYYSKEHQIVLIDCASLGQTTLSLGEDSGGYEGELILGKVSTTIAQDILVGLPTGGSGGIINYYLISCAEGEPTILAGPDVLTEGLHFQISLMDDFIVKVKNGELDKVCLLDLKKLPSSEDTLSEVYKDIYSPSGKLLEPEEGFVDPSGMIELRDIDGDGISELVGYHSIWVVYHANSIGIAKPSWKWIDNELKLIALDVSLRCSPDD
ncbi:MAG: hypothetical protein GX872_05865 [Firmicutes bacterium]|nr:hypothetical protein [Bacillota bacterium]